MINVKKQSPVRKNHINDDTNLSLATELAAMAGKLTTLHFRLYIYIQLYLCRKCYILQSGRVYYSFFIHYILIKLKKNYELHLTNYSNALNI